MGVHNPNMSSDYAACGGSTSLGENLAAGGGFCNSGITATSGVCTSGCDSVNFSATSANFCTLEYMIDGAWVNGEGGAETCDNNGGVNGHCTQVVWATSEFVGCSYTMNEC